MLKESKVMDYKGYKIYRVEDKEPDDFEVWKAGKKVVSCETETAAKEWVDDQVNESQINRMVLQILEGKVVRKVLIESDQEGSKVDILGIGLLSQLKYDKYKMRIPKLGDSWWLASAIVNPSDESACGALVWDDERVICRYVAMYYAVRPMLDVATDLEPGRKFKWMDHTWTVITKNFALCDESFTNMMFREDADAKDASEYAKSDIKKWLDNWWDSHGKKNRTKVEIL